MLTLEQHRSVCRVEVHRCGAWQVSLSTIGMALLLAKAAAGDVGVAPASTTGCLFRAIGYRFFFPIINPDWLRLQRPGNENVLLEPPYSGHQYCGQGYLDAATSQWSYRFMKYKTAVISMMTHSAAARP